MKNKIIIILILAALSVVGSLVFKSYSAKSQAVSRTGLTLDLNFGNNNAAAAPTVYDSSGFGRHATSTAGAKAPTCGGKFCNFDGADYMTANATDKFNSAEISIAIKFSPNGGTSALNVLFQTAGPAGSRYYIQPYDNLMYIQLGSTTIENISSSVYAPYWKTGKENVLVLISSATTDRTDVWLNGVKILNQDTTAWTQGNPTNFFAGFDGSGSYLAGKMYYFKVWNRLLTDAEVANLSADRKDFVTAPSRSASSTGQSSVRGLVGYWTMDSNDINGSAIYDKSGFNNRGTGTNITSADLTTGKIKQAFDFDSTEYISAPHSASLSPTTALTISAWIKVNTVAGNKYFINKGTISNGYHIYDSGSDVSFFLGGDGGGISSGSRCGGVWCHIVATWDGSTERIYRDGIFQNQQAHASALTYSNDTFYINAYDGAINMPTAVIDDVRIYNYALSAQDVANLYNSSARNYSITPPRAGLVGYWTMDNNDVNGSNLYDKSGLNNRGTLVGTSNASGKIKESRSFNGSTNYVDFSAIDISGGLTYTMWIKLNATPTNWNLIQNKRTLLRVSSNKLSWFPDVDTTVVDSNTITIANSRWYLVTVTQSGTAYNMYLDGVNIGTGTTAALDNTTGDDKIAAYNAEINFNGSIDDVRVYNYALSAQEVANLYNSSARTYLK